MNKMPHIQLDMSIGTSLAILPGDPARVDVIAKYLSDVKEEAFNREYKSITGTYKGCRILAMSTGMGGPSAAIGVEELADLGVTDMVRIGSCGALQSDMHLGQLVLCDRAVCDDGTSQSYLDYLRYASPEIDSFIDREQAPGAAMFSAGPEQGRACDILTVVADRQLLRIGEMAAKEMEIPYVTGPTRCHDALYLSFKSRLDAFYSSRGIMASDMETAAIFAVAAARGVRALSVLNVVVEWKKSVKEGISSYKDGEDRTEQGEENEILLALEILCRRGNI